MPQGVKASALVVAAVAEVGGPSMFANRHHVREFNPKRKEPHWPLIERIGGQTIMATLPARAAPG
jgi:hypothetical protein